MLSLPFAFQIQNSGVIKQQRLLLLDLKVFAVFERDKSKRNTKCLDHLREMYLLREKDKATFDVPLTASLLN